jgi:hypothetical protein
MRSGRPHVAGEAESEYLSESEVGWFVDDWLPLSALLREEGIEGVWRFEDNAGVDGEVGALKYPEGEGRPDGKRLVVEECWFAKGPL